MIRFPFPLGKGLGVRLSATTTMLMTHSNKITSGQKVHPDKLAFAKRLRREMTPPERRLWKALRGNMLDGFHFRRQQVIEGYIADFYCDAAKLAIELDGLRIRSTGDTMNRATRRFLSWECAFSEFRTMRSSTLRRPLSISGKSCGRAEEPNPNPFPRGKGNRTEDGLLTFGKGENRAGF